VRRGSLEIAGALDLHGMTQREAHDALISFLQRMKKQGARVALVVTGKGGRSRSGDPTPGVLRQRLPEWLAEPTLRPLATGYAQAHRKHGGGGAFYVFVRRSDAAG
jgi:DNA-nicking Smr family endonuclease